MRRSILPELDRTWQSRCLELCGLTTRASEAQLIRDARALLAVRSNVQPPAPGRSSRMGDTGSRGKFVRDPADRLIDVEDDPLAFIDKAKSVDIPAWGTLQRLPPDCVDAVHVMLAKGPDIAAWRRRQVQALNALAKRAHRVLDQRLRTAVRSPP